MNDSVELTKLDSAILYDASTILWIIHDCCKAAIKKTDNPETVKELFTCMGQVAQAAITCTHYSTRKDKKLAGVVPIKYDS